MTETSKTAVSEDPGIQRRERSAEEEDESMTTSFQIEFR